MRGIAHGMKPHGGVGPSPEVAKEMLGHHNYKGAMGQKKKDREDTPNEATARKKKRKDARRGAIHGYERSGGLWDKIKDRLAAGARGARDLADKNK